MYVIYRRLSASVVTWQQLLRKCCKCWTWAFSDCRWDDCRASGDTIRTTIRYLAICSNTIGNTIYWDKNAPASPVIWAEEALTPETVNMQHLNVNEKNKTKKQSFELPVICFFFAASNHKRRRFYIDIFFVLVLFAGVFTAPGTTFTSTCLFPLCWEPSASLLRTKLSTPVLDCRTLTLHCWTT